MQTSRFMQPGKEGVVIATHNMYQDFGRLFLWYYDRPRKFYKGNPVHKLVYHDGKLLGMQFYNNHGGYTKYGLKDILENRVVFESCFKHLYSDGENLYGARESEKMIDVHEDSSFYGYNPIEIGKIFDNEFETDIVRHMFVKSIASESENVFLSERKFPIVRLSTDLGARCVRISKGNEETLLDLGNIPPPYCLLPTKGGLLAGVEFGIWNVTEKKSVKHFSESHRYFRDLRELDGYKLDGGDVELINDARDFLKENGLPLNKERSQRIDDCLVGILRYEFDVRHMVEFQGKLVFSTFHNLYISGTENPVWRFRDYIVGLVRVDDEDLLRKLKGETNVRGAKNAEVVSLLTSIKLAA